MNEPKTDSVLFISNFKNFASNISKTYIKKIDIESILMVAKNQVCLQKESCLSLKINVDAKLV